MSQAAAGASGLPRHVAVIMDGNGRWAQRRALPRHLGHRAGAKAVRATVEGCARRGVEALTIFAFSSENWQRPQDEVTRLMELFVESIDKEVDELHRNGIRMRFIGDLSRLRAGLGAKIAAAEARTAANQRMTLFIAVSYGGRWDIVEAARRLAARAVAGEITPAAIDEALFADQLQLAGAPEPDLFIRTGGEQRISNFLLWNLAYSELYFCDTLWPDFDDAALERRVAFLRQPAATLWPDRRAGRTMNARPARAHRDRAAARSPGHRRAGLVAARGGGGDDRGRDLRWRLRMGRVRAAALRAGPARVRRRHPAGARGRRDARSRPALAHGLSCASPPSGG